ncbi:MAG: TolC family protein, partial [Sediminispirochaetaceae bacterium]
MKRTAFTVLILLAALTSAPLFGLNFDEVLRTIEENYDMQSARLEVQILEAEARAAVSPEDIRFDLDPSLKITSETDGEFAGETSLSGSTSIFIPLGLSSMEQDNLNTIRSSITAARLKASETYTSTYILLFSLYQDLWLLQQEAAVLEAEVKSSELYMELMQERFNAGSLPLSSLSLVEETMIERQEALIRNGLAQRLAWFELSLNTGLDGDMPELEALDFEIEEIPRPPELETWIVENHPLIEQSRIGVEKIRLNLERL